MLVRVPIAVLHPHMRLVQYVGPDGLTVGSFLNPVNALEQNSDLYMQVTEPEVVYVITGAEVVYSVAFDIKAMRKIDEGSRLYTVFGTDGAVTDVVLTLSFLTAMIAS